MPPLQQKILAYDDQFVPPRVLSENDLEVEIEAAKKFRDGKLRASVVELKAATSVSRRFGIVSGIVPQVDVYARETANMENNWGKVRSINKSVRYFSKYGNLPDSSIDDIYREVLQKGYDEISASMVRSDLDLSSEYLRDFRPDELLRRLYAQELKLRLEEEVVIDLEDRFFEGIALRNPKATLMASGVWENFRHKIHGLFEGDQTESSTFHHVLINDGSDDEVLDVIERFREEGVHTLSGRATVLLSTPEQRLIESRHRRIRESLLGVAQKYEQLADRTFVSLLGVAPWTPRDSSKLSEDIFVGRRIERARRDAGSARALVTELSQSSSSAKPLPAATVWRPAKVGWTERFHGELAAAFFAFSASHQSSASQMAHAAWLLATANKEEVSAYCRKSEGFDPQVIRHVLYCLDVVGKEEHILAMRMLRSEAPIVPAEALFSQIEHLRGQGNRYLSKVIAKIPKSQQNGAAVRFSRLMRDNIAKSLVKWLSESNKISYLIKNDDIMGVLSLCVIEEYIREKPEQEQYDFVIQLLDRSLGDVFARAELQEGERLRLLDRLTRDILGLQSAKLQTPWVARVTGSTQPHADVPPLPKVGEVRLWIDRDRSLKQSAPDFVREVYGRWLGKDVPTDRHLTKGQLNDLDPSLYTALYRWEKKEGNVLPDDLSFGTKYVTTEEELEAFEAGDRPKGRKDYNRLYSASLRARSSERG